MTATEILSYTQGVELRFDTKEELIKFLEEEQKKITEALRIAKSDQTNPTFKNGSFYDYGASNDVLSTIGVERIDTLERADEYGFEEVRVFKNKNTGKLAWLYESGSSGDTFGDGVKEWKELEPLPETFATLESEVKQMDKNACDKFEFLARVAKAMNQ